MGIITRTDQKQQDLDLDLVLVNGWSKIRSDYELIDVWTLWSMLPAFMTAKPWPCAWQQKNICEVLTYAFDQKYFAVSSSYSAVWVVTHLRTMNIMLLWRGFQLKIKVYWKQAINIPCAFLQPVWPLIFLGLIVFLRVHDSHFAVVNNNEATEILHRHCTLSCLVSSASLLAKSLIASIWSLRSACLKAVWPTYNVHTWKGSPFRIARE